MCGLYVIRVRSELVQPPWRIFHGEDPILSSGIFRTACHSRTGHVPQVKRNAHAFQRFEICRRIIISDAGNDTDLICPNAGAHCSIQAGATRCTKP